jgi:GH15 family glucan-1,4-alpha-glucosidase
VSDRAIVPRGWSTADGSFRASLASLRSHQSENGAFIASPDFGEYQYCWLRDASFVAYALDRGGEHEASARYHAWVDRTIGSAGIGPRIDEAIAHRLAGGQLVPGEMPPARFSLTGEVVADDWPNFQIDGYGTWLWSLSEHLALSGRLSLPPEWRDTVARTARYISTFAFDPCFDVWEENGGDVHTCTLASVTAGLAAASAMLDDPAFAVRARSVDERIRNCTTEDGHFRKSDSRAEVDGSLLWLGPVFEIAAPDNPAMVATVSAIEAALTVDGGVRRYAGDTYFGGGTWPVLTCSLGWYYVRAGRLAGAQDCLEWTRGHIDERGRLAEQFGGDERDPVHYREWVERWGHPARDLLWSHAMYVVLCAELAECS